LSTVSASKLREVTVFDFYATILMPDGACVVDLQWLIYKIHTLDPKSHWKYTSSAEVRLCEYECDESEKWEECDKFEFRDLSMLCYSQAQTNFERWDSADWDAIVFVGKYDLKRMTEADTTHHDQTQQLTAFNHAYLKFMYAQYKANKP
jgi:hypothetical protein